MKNSFLTLLIAIVITNIACKTTEQDVAVAFSGVVNFMTGTVKIVDQAGNKKDAQVGDIISEGSKVVTIGDNSMVQIYIGQNALRVLGNTELVMATLKTKTKSGTEEVDLSIEKGSVFTKVIRKLAKEDKFKVRTKTATASIRGTEFLVEQLNKSTNISCLEGKVAVQDLQEQQKEVILNGKEEANVVKGKNIVKKQISEDKLKKLQIMSEIKIMQEDIKQKYLEQKEDIRKKFEEDREIIKKAVSDQKEKNKKMLESQKKIDQENIEQIKGETKDSAKKATGDAVKSMENAKQVDIDSQKKAANEKKESVKPKIDVNQFKQ